MARLRGQEKLLMEQLQKQELVLHRLKLLNEPGNTYKGIVDQRQDTQYSGQQGPQSQEWKTAFRKPSLKYLLLGFILQKQEADDV